MISNELKLWLDENASRMLETYLEKDLLGSVPEGWSFDKKAVAHYGGDGQGDDYWTVWSFKNTDGTSVLIRVNGWYASYDGTEYNNWQEVRAVETTITEYEGI